MHINLPLGSNILLSPCLVRENREMVKALHGCSPLWLPQTLPTVYSPYSKPASNDPTGMCHLSPLGSQLGSPCFPPHSCLRVLRTSKSCILSLHSQIRPLPSRCAGLSPLNLSAACDTMGCAPLLDDPLTLWFLCSACPLDVGAPRALSPVLLSARALGRLNPYPASASLCPTTQTGSLGRLCL